MWSEIDSGSFGFSPPNTKLLSSRGWRWEEASGACVILILNRRRAAPVFNLTHRILSSETIRFPREIEEHHANYISQLRRGLPHWRGARTPFPFPDNRLSVLHIPHQRLKNHTVCAVHLRAEDSSHPHAKFTILHSHGNAADMGSMMMRYALLCHTLNVNVVGYDYSGYGQSRSLNEGEPTGVSPFPR